MRGVRRARDGVREAPHALPARGSAHEVLPLVAVTTDKDPRSRPGSKPGLRVLAGTIIEGLEDLAEIADGVA